MNTLQKNIMKEFVNQYHISMVGMGSYEEQRAQTEKDLEPLFSSLPLDFDLAMKACYKFFAPVPSSLPSAAGLVSVGAYPKKGSVLRCMLNALEKNNFQHRWNHFTSDDELLRAYAR